MVARLDASTALAKSLSTPRLRPWLGAACIDWGIIVVTFVVAGWLDHVAAYALAIVVLGSRQQGLGALFHDAAHHLACPGRRLNDLLGNLLCAFPLGLTLGGYRNYHLAHHRHLGSERDPENHHKREAGQWNLPVRPAHTGAHFALDLVGGGAPHLWLAAQLTRPSLGGALGLLAYWSVAITAFVWLGLWWVPLVWVVAIATVFWAGVRLRIFTEHLGIKGTHRIDVPRFLGWFLMPHNIGLHWEHHRFPGVPWWRLGELRENISEPAIVPLSTLLREFLRARPLASGDVRRDAAQLDGEPAAGSTSRPSSTRGVSLFLHAGLPLAFGTLIYAWLRPERPRLVGWLDLPRVEPGSFGPWMQPVIEVGPDAAFAYALMATLLILWRDHPRRARGWAVVALVLPIAWELFQQAGIAPGTFDLVDALASLVASAVAFVVCGPAGSAQRTAAAPTTTETNHG